MEHEKKNKNEPMTSNWHGVQLIAIAENHPVNKWPFMLYCLYVVRAKTAKPIQMLFRAQTRVGPSNHAVKVSRSLAVLNVTGTKLVLLPLFHRKQS